MDEMGLLNNLLELAILIHSVKINDRTFFSWTQRIMLAVGAVLIVRAIYLINL